MLPALEPYIGPAAGVATSVLWTFTSLAFTGAGRRLGAVFVNGARIALAIILLGVTHRLLTGVWVPEARFEQVLYLALSGIVGLTIGDQALFSAFVAIGPRMAMLIMTTSPLLAAFFGWVALGETLHATAWVGIVLVIGGVGWVVLERPPLTTPADTRHRARGIVLAFVGAACQAAGLLLSKQGMGHGWLACGERMDPQAATLLRMVFAGVGFLPIFIIHRARQRKRRAVAASPTRSGSRGVGYFLTVCGAFVGPYLGVWMSLVASDRAPLGIAQTLCSLSPVFILPLAVWIQKERLSVRAVLGAFVAVAGSAILFAGAG